MDPTAGVPTRSWWWSVAGIAAVGAAIRAVYVVVVLENVPPGLDAAWYTLQGGSLRVGTGFTVPATLFGSDLQPTAAFPPAYPAYQAMWQSLFGDGPIAVRLAGVVLGSVTIVLTAALGRLLVGPRPALVAAGVVAIDPLLVAVDGSSMSESLTVPLVVAAVLISVQVIQRGVSAGRLALLGLVCGAAILTRQDLALLGVLLVGGVVVLGAAPTRGRRLLAGAVAVLTVAAVVTPWVVRNQRTVDAPTVSTLSPASALAGANCDATYRGDAIGSWEYSCVLAAERSDASEVERATALRRTAIDHARAHTARLSLVVPARMLRVWGFWDPRDQIPREVEESRHERWQQLAWVTDGLIVVTGAWGLVRLVRTRGREAYPLIVPLIAVTTTAAVGYGNTRFGAIAHPMFAIGIAALIARLVVRRGGTDGTGPAEGRDRVPAGLRSSGANSNPDIDGEAGQLL